MFTEMKSKARILSTAAMTALIAGGAYAQTAEVTTDTQIQTETDGNAIVEGAENAAEATGDAIQDGAAATGEVIENGVNATGDAIQDGATAAGEAIQDGASAAGETVQDGVDATSDALDKGADMVEEGVADTTEAVEDAISGTDMAMDSPIAAMTVGDILGKNVLSAEGEDVGEIDYVIMGDTDVAFVIGVGGFLGLGEHTVGIPMDRFSLTADNELQLQAMTEEELEAMPEVDESGLESLPDDAVIGELK